MIYCLSPCSTVSRLACPESLTLSREELVDGLLGTSANHYQTIHQQVTQLRSQVEHTCFPRLYTLHLYTLHQKIAFRGDFFLHMSNKITNFAPQNCFTRIKL